MVEPEGDPVGAEPVRDDAQVSQIEEVAEAEVPSVACGVQVPQWWWKVRNEVRSRGAKAKLAPEIQSHVSANALEFRAKVAHA